MVFRGAKTPNDTNITMSVCYSFFPEKLAEFQW